MINNETMGQSFLHRIAQDMADKAKADAIAKATALQPAQVAIGTLPQAPAAIPPVRYIELPEQRITAPAVIPPPTAFAAFPAAAPLIKPEHLKWWVIGGIGVVGIFAISAMTSARAAPGGFRRR